MNRLVYLDHVHTQVYTVWCEVGHKFLTVFLLIKNPLRLIWFVFPLFQWNWEWNRSHSIAMGSGLVSPWDHMELIVDSRSTIVWPSHPDDTACFSIRPTVLQVKLFVRKISLQPTILLRVCVCVQKLTNLAGLFRQFLILFYSGFTHRSGGMTVGLRLRSIGNTCCREEETIGAIQFPIPLSAPFKLPAIRAPCQTIEGFNVDAELSHCLYYPRGGTSEVDSQSTSRNSKCQQLKFPLTVRLSKI